MCNFECNVLWDVLHIIITQRNMCCDENWRRWRARTHVGWAYVWVWVIKRMNMFVCDRCAEVAFSANIKRSAWMMEWMNEVNYLRVYIYIYNWLANYCEFYVNNCLTFRFVYNLKVQRTISLVNNQIFILFRKMIKLIVYQI